jgi:membrane-associated protein
MLLIGYFLGRAVPGIDKYIELMILVIVFLSVLPAIIAWWRDRAKTKAAASAAAPSAVPDP